MFFVVWKEKENRFVHFVRFRRPFRRIRLVQFKHKCTYKCVTFDTEIFEIIDSLSFDKLHVLAGGPSVRIAQMTLERHVIVLDGTARETVLKTTIVRNFENYIYFVFSLSCRFCISNGKFASLAFYFFLLTSFKQAAKHASLVDV